MTNPRQPASTRRLNVGCGRDVRPAGDGWVNLDMSPLPGIDVVHDLEVLPWPFADGEFDHVLCSHVLEHVPQRLPGYAGDGLLRVLEEIHRILAPGGILEVLVPVYHDPGYWMDPSHTRVITLHTFHWVSPETPDPWYTHARFRLREWSVHRRAPRFDRALPLGRQRIGLFVHVWDRAPWARRLMPTRAAEFRMLLDRAPR